MKDTLIVDNKNTVDVELLKKSISSNSLKPAMEVVNDTSKSILELYKNSIKDVRDLNYNVKDLIGENSRLQQQLKSIKSNSPTVNLTTGFNSSISNLDDPVIQEAISKETKAEIKRLKQEVSNKSDIIDEFQLEKQLHLNKISNIKQQYTLDIEKIEMNDDLARKQLEIEYEQEVSLLKKEHQKDLNNLSLTDIARDRKVMTAVEKIISVVDGFKSKFFFKRTINRLNELKDCLREAKFVNPSYY